MNRYTNKDFKYEVGSPMERLQQLENELETKTEIDVVYCKDCEHLGITGCYGECRRTYMGIVNPRDYCSRGIRRK